MKYLRFLIFLVAIISAQAEDLYVRPNGSNAGLTNGSNWSNAFNGFSDVVWGSGAGQLGPGDTLWVAGGNYTQQLIINGSGTSGNMIQIKRVRTSDAVPVAAAGWNPAFDSTVVNNNMISSDGKGFYSIDGRIPGGWSNTFGDGGEGWHANNCSGPIVGQYMDFTGPGWGKFCGFGIQIYRPSSGNSGPDGYYFGHIKFDGITQQFSTNVHGGTLEYCTFLNAGPGTTLAGGDPTECHSDMIYASGGDRWTYRYNYFYNSFSQAFFFEWDPQNGTYIYGNVADKGPLGTGTFIQLKQGFTWGDFHIFNNTFIGWDLAVFYRGSSSSTANELKNNIFWQTTWTNESGWNGKITANWNQYSGAKGDSGAQSIGNISNPFVGTGTPPQNWQLAAGKAPINAGTNLGSPYNFDMNGNQRGADGTWDVGAFEFGGADVTRPAISSATINPAGTQITINFSEGVNFGAGGSGGFTLNMNGGTSVMSSPSGMSTSAITFTLSRVINAGEFGTLSYNQPGTGWQDLATPPNTLATFPPPTVTVTNNSTQGPPALNTATINPAGNQLTLVFSQTVQAGSGGNAGWTLNVTPSASLSFQGGTGSNTLTYNITGRVINLGESLTLGYAQPGNGIESTASGADVLSITNGTVTNNSTQGQTSVPAITLPAGPYFGTQTTTIIDADSGAGAVIHYTVDNSTPTASSPVYSTPLVIATNQTINAIATWTGHLNSAVASSAYEVVSWVSSGTNWKTFAVPQQNGTSTWNFSITAPVAGSDAVVGFGPSAVSAYSGMACIIQFNNNTINAINGGGYTTGPAYTPGAVYNFVATINVAAHTWTLTSTPASGGTTTTIVTNAAFRTEQAAASQLSYVGIQANSGTITVSNMSFPGGASSARYIGLRGVPASGGAVP